MESHHKITDILFFSHFIDLFFINLDNLSRFQYLFRYPFFFLCSFSEHDNYFKLESPFVAIVFDGVNHAL